MKRLLHLALFIGAVLGLVGQGTAVASTRVCSEMIALQAAKDDGCTMMGIQKDHGTPAKHDPLGCAAMVGCTVPATLEAALVIAPSLPFKPLAAIWPSPHAPADRSIAPAQEPPAFLL